MGEVLGRSAGRLWLFPIRSRALAYGLPARRKGRLAKFVLIRVLVMLREQPCEELCMQFWGVLVIDGDLWRIQSLDQTTDEIKNCRLVICFYKPRELGP